MKDSMCRVVSPLLLAAFLASPTAALAETLTVFPSGDESGFTDYLNLQSAFDSAPAGSTVKLAPGHFYVNQGIVVEGFHGTLRGTLNDHDEEVLTTLEAVAPFHFSFASSYVGDAPWTEYNDKIVPSVIFFEFPEEEITVRDLILVAAAPEYVEARPMWANPFLLTTALNHFITDFGSDVDPSYRNLTFIAGEGDYFGSNVAAAIHSMRGPACPEGCARLGDAALHGTGNAVFKNIQASNVGDYMILPMWYKNGRIVIEDVVNDLASAVSVWGMIDVDLEIMDVESTNSWRSLWLSFISGGATKVRRLTSQGGVSPAVYIQNADNVDIRDSTLSGANGFGEWWRAPVYIRRHNRNVTLVDNAFVGMTDVPMGVFALPEWGNTGVVLKSNYYDTANFPGDPDGAYAIVLGSDDSLVVEPGLRPNQVLDLGVNNTIRVGGM